MKTMMKRAKYIFLCLVLAFAMPVWADENGEDHNIFEDKNYQYWVLSEEDATVAVFHWIKEYDEEVLEDIEIPQTVQHNGKTYTVTEIRFNAFDSAFDHRKPIRSVKFPSTLKKIGAYSFRYCQLRTLELPEGLEEIEEGAFMHTHELSSISFPQSLKIIGNEAFRDNYVISQLHLPRGLESIGFGAFLNLTNLMDVKMPEKLNYLGEYAFWGCKSLYTISLPPGLKAIWDYTFAECINLEEVTINEGVEYIGEWAFRECTNLKKVHLPESLKEIGRYCFTFSSGMESIHIPENVTYIGDAAFGWCDKLKDINIPKGVNMFNKHVIAHTGFQTVELPENIDTLGIACFMECADLLGVTLPSKVSFIDESAFIDVPHLQYLRLKTTVPPKIINDAFDRYDFTLYVPTGCMKAYKEAAHWSKFTDIREVGNDDTVAVDYPESRCQLTICDSEKGETTLYVEMGSSPEIELKPANNKVISKLLFNQQDVTERLHSNHRLKLPIITENSTLEIKYSAGD